MKDVIRYRVDGRVATITLNRPEKRNALNKELVDALASALRRAEEDDAIRCIIITGEGSAFSAGADLAALQRLQDASRDENESDSRRLADLFRRIHLHPKAVIARINGHAIAGGCGLAAACDISVAAAEAKLGFTEVRIGFVPAIISVFVLRKLGETAARDLLLRGRLISAEEAERVGLITRAVPSGDLDDTVDGIARDLATETGPGAVALTKRLLSAVPGKNLDDALDYAVEMNVEARGTDECRAGVRAFLDKEDPPWKREASR